MESNMLKLRSQLDSVTKYLRPLLPLANCHMVEFITERHWDKHVPLPLKDQLENGKWEDVVNKFWDIAGNTKCNDVAGSCELTRFIKGGQSHCLAVDGDSCLSKEQCAERIRSSGGDVKEPIMVKEFMSQKKSYEVRTMSPLIASLFEVCSATHCVDLGGGRGYLPVILDLGYAVPSLALDCDHVALKAGRRRDDLIKKQWPSICNSGPTFGSPAGAAHHFVHSYVTQDTDLCGLVRTHFPEHGDQDIRVLLTGLHTCGNLGPDSLRIFLSNPAMKSILNVPCCYHLLSEEVDAGCMWGVFEETCAGGTPGRVGFPMSQHLSGYHLGRNARMLAAQSIERVVGSRQLPSISLHYRAVLQVIIKKHLPQSRTSEGKLKRIAAKSNNFVEYFRQADAILDLGLHDSLSDSYLTDLYQSFDGQRKELILFYLIRLCLAQVIETVILLDRLLYLYENGYRNSCLVKLFDARLSPRCHAILAIR